MANYIEYIKVGSNESWPVRDKEAQEKLDKILDLVYPVGSIYMSTNGAVSPDTLFGGIWERIQDRFLLAAGDSYAAGTTGGEAQHVLTEDEMPRHKHPTLNLISNPGAETITTNGYNVILTNDNLVAGGQTLDISRVTSGETNISGGDVAHNNMPPYLTVHMWKRTD